MRNRIVRALLFLFMALIAVSVFGRDLPPNFDALAAQRIKTSPAAVQSSLGELAKPGTQVQVESRLGIPTFIWANPQKSRLPNAKSSPAEAARAYVSLYAGAFGLSDSDVANATVASVHDIGKGPIVVKLRQSVNGIDVFRDEMNVTMDRKFQLVAISGYIPSTASVTSSQFSFGEKSAVTAAIRDFTGVALSADAVSPNFRQIAGFALFDVASNEPAAQVPAPAAVKKVYFNLPGGLVPAYYVLLTVEDFETAGTDAYAYVVSAVDGSLLFRKNMTEEDSYSYRVWADGSPAYLPQDGPQGTNGSPNLTGLPDGYQAPFVAPSLISLQNSPFSQNDPWLPPAAGETLGNNVEAYVDLVAPDGYNPPTDFRATTTTPGVFDRTYDVTQQPNVSADQQMASLAQLFYDNNFMHDWYYDAGFDEAAGNAQASNFGRGGAEGDSIKAEGQDYSGTNNANMQTNPDGFRPRMQMYVFTPNTARYVKPTNGTLANTGLNVGTAAWGPQAFDLTADVIYPATNQNGCVAFAAGTFTGKIAMLDRGTCTFSVKAQNAQDAGAVGCIIVNNSAGIINMSGTGPTIPSLSILQSDGATLKTDLANAIVLNARMYREAGISRDGTIDNQIIAHEWAHYLSNRLIGNAAGLGNTQGRGMGEGWSDFNSIIMTVKEGDDQLGTNANFNGVYAMAAYTTSGNAPLGGGNNGYYFGIRRVPYSTDFAKNNLTYRIIANGNPISGIACSFNCDGTNNAEVHNTGEVWASMLWECYAALLRDTLGASPRLTFDEARDRMRMYLVASLKMTPNNPTVLEARDALLAAAYANDNTDFLEFATAFAKRGAGIRAQAVDRFDTTNGGGVLTGSGESYVTGNDLIYLGTTMAEKTTCDNDGVFDNGETVTLTVTIKNVGTGALSATTATLSSPSNPNVTFPNGNVINFPATNPFQTTQGTIDVALSLANFSGIQQLDLDMAIDDPSFAIPGAILETFSVRANYDNVANMSATDDVESDIVASTSQIGTGSAGWSRYQINPVSHVWNGPDASAVSDIRLITPVLNVGSGTFTVTFQQEYALENTFDGGVIEVSTDGGATWGDAMTLATITPAYAVSPLVSGSPLAGRRAYTGTQASWQPVTVDFGTALANKTVQLRFRVGTDSGVGGSGWFIDNIAFNGILNTPFAIIVPHQGNCTPQTMADSYATDEDTPITVPAPGVLANDYVIGTTITDVTIDTQPTYGSVTMNSDGSFLYTPNPNFNGQDGFAYVAHTSTLTGFPTPVTITVNPVNDAPVAQSDSYETDEDATLSASVSVLANDSDVDGDSLSAQLVTAPDFGNLTFNADGTFTYVPNPNYHGIDYFDYVASDGSLSSPPTTVEIIVQSVNDPPVAVDDAYSIQTGTALTVAAPGVMANDSDVDSIITAAVTVMPAHGLVSFNSNGSFQYLPNSGYSGNDTFTYNVTDGQYNDQATVNISVVPSMPTVVSLSPNSTPAGQAQTITITGTNFQGGVTVKIGGYPVPAFRNSATSISASAPAFMVAGTLQDVVIANPDGGTVTAKYVVDFTDVPQSNAFHNFVNTIFRNGITAGCGAGNFCPSNSTTRAQMAVFLLLSEHGSSYVPPTRDGQMFADVPPGHPFKKWIEQLATEGITAGCGGGNYCPSSAVTRAQMAVFLLLTKEGASYVPPPAVGIFSDVPVSNGFAPFIEELYNRGITAGCGGGRYCPSSPVTRGQMSVFLTTMFNLP